MRRPIVLCLLAMLLVSRSASYAQESYKGIVYATPSGWTSGLQDGQFLLVPTNMTAETALAVVLFGTEQLGGKTFEDWFNARLADDLAIQGKIVQDSPVQKGTAGALRFLSTGRTVQDAGGGVRLLVYHALSDGAQAGLAVVVTASDAAVTKYQAGIQSLIASLNLAGAGSTSKPGAGLPRVGGAGPPDPSRPPAAETKTRITVSDLVGHWSHSTSSYSDYVSSSTGSYAGSSTIAYGQGYDFAEDGTYKFDFAGIWNSVYIKEKDSGTWGFEQDRLVVRSRERNQVKKYQFIEYKTAPDGTVFLTLLPADYPPTEGNIGLYGEKYVRTAKK